MTVILLAAAADGYSAGPGARLAGIVLTDVSAAAAPFAFSLGLLVPAATARPTASSPRWRRTPRWRLEYDVEIRKVICTTNAIESVNARYR